MKKIISLLICLVIVLSALSLASCKSNKVYYFNDSGVSAEDVHKEDGVIVDKTNFPDDVEIVITKIKERDRRFKIAVAAIPEAAKIYLYDISALRNGVNIEPLGPVNVKFPVPSAFNEKKYEMDIYYISDTGVVEYIESSINKKSIDTVLEHFSLYAVVLFDKPEEETSSDIDVNSDNNTSPNYPIVITPSVDGTSSNTSSNNVPSNNPTVNPSVNNTSSEFVGDNIEMDMNEDSSKPVSSTPSGNTSSNPNDNTSSNSTSSARPNNPNADGYTNDYVIY